LLSRRNPWSSEMASRVDHQAAPGEARLVVDGDGRRGETLRGNLHQLQEGLQTVQDAQSIGRGQFYGCRSDLQLVGLVFIELLYQLAGAGGPDRETSWAGGTLLCEQNSSLARQRIEKALAGQEQARFAVAADRNREVAVNDELAIAGYDVRGQGHQRGRLRACCAEDAGKRQGNKAQRASLHEQIPWKKRLNTEEV